MLNKCEISTAKVDSQIKRTESVVAKCRHMNYIQSDASIRSFFCLFEFPHKKGALKNHFQFRCVSDITDVHDAMMNASINRTNRE